MFSSPHICVYYLATCIGVGTHAAQVQSRTSVVMDMCCPQCSLSSAALNRLGLMQLELTQTGCVLLKLA